MNKNKKNSPEQYEKLFSFINKINNTKPTTNMKFTKLTQGKKDEAFLKAIFEEEEPTKILGKENFIDDSPQSTSIHYINLNDLVKTEVLRINLLEKDRDLPKEYSDVIKLINENKKLLEDQDLFVTTKNNFSTNFNKLCNSLGINTNNFKKGKEFAFKTENLFLLHDILSNNRDYLHILKYGITKKNLGHSQKTISNLLSFIDSEIQNSEDFNTAKMTFILLFLVNKNMEIGVKSKIIYILTVTNISLSQRISIIQYYLDELEDLHTEISCKISEAQAYSPVDIFMREERYHIPLVAAKYITSRETSSSVPTQMINEILNFSQLPYIEGDVKVNRQTLIKELKIALNHYYDNSNKSSNYLYIEN